MRFAGCAWICTKMHQRTGFGANSRGSCNCIIYMTATDPPYNTSNDFVYEDDFADPMARYKEVTQQTTKSNPETMGRFHTNWLNMMYPRLRLAANLLRDDGVIFISIDDNEVFNLKKICDEVFGEENFVGNVIWKRAFAPKNDAKYFSASHDYIVVYAKNITSFKIGKLPRTEEANARYSNPDNDPRGSWTADNLTVKHIVQVMIIQSQRPEEELLIHHTVPVGVLAKKDSPSWLLIIEYILVLRETMFLV